MKILLSESLSLPPVDITRLKIDSEIVRMISEETAMQYQIIPVAKVGDRLTLAMADPLNMKAVEDIEMISHCTVQVFVATISDVMEAIQRSYGVPHDA